MQLLGRVIGRADYPAGVSQNDGRRVLFAQSQNDWSDIFNIPHTRGKPHMTAESNITISHNVT